MQQAWKEIEQIVLENEKLAVPLAEPYLSRGDLWCRIGGYEDALADYLKATELFFNGNPTPGEQARHLARLRTCLESAVAQPRPHFPSDAATEFDKGLTAFRAGDATIALSCFAECTRLMPDMPLYRVYHALALEQLNQSDDAKRQVAIALSLIRATGADAADQMALIHRALEPVQGRLRLWLAVQLEIAIKLPTLDRTSVVR
jgi:tetratricopeptide (TPR) repeat protein